MTVEERMDILNYISTKVHIKKVENGKTFNLLSSPGHGIPGFSGMLGNTRQREKEKEK